MFLKAICVYLAETAVSLQECLSAAFLSFPLLIPPQVTGINRHRALFFKKTCDGWFCSRTVVLLNSPQLCYWEHSQLVQMLKTSCWGFCSYRNVFIIKRPDENFQPAPSSIF